jgi:hypothetical protein
MHAPRDEERTEFGVIPPRVSVVVVFDATHSGIMDAVCSSERAPRSQRISKFGVTPSARRSGSMYSSWPTIASPKIECWRGSAEGLNSSLGRPKTSYRRDGIFSVCKAHTSTKKKEEKKEGTLDQGTSLVVQERSGRNLQ